MAKQRYKQKFVTLREKKLANGKISLYIDIYSESKRYYEFLKLYIYEKPGTPQERTHNQEILHLAEQIRADKESNLKHAEHGVPSPVKKRINFLDYYQAYYDRYEKKDKRMIKTSFDYFVKFLADEYNKTTIYPKEINEFMVERYRDYLIKKLKGETPHSYFSRFKKVIKQAYRENYFIKNPAENVSCPNPENFTKAILSLAEIKLLSETECGNPEVKRAFLFCLNTGLRFVDVKTLKWSEIDGEILRKPQEKTKKDAIIYLNKNALRLLGDSGNPSDLIFKLPTIDSSIRTVKHWATKAKINKNVTWHSARHSFAVNLLTNKTDIKTVSSLLGHSGLKHTEKYTHVVDELKRKAVNTLPNISIKKANPVKGKK